MVVWMIADRMGCGVYRCLIPALGLKEQGVTDSEFIDRKDVEPDRHGGYAFRLLNGAEALIVQRPGHPIFKTWFAEMRRRDLPMVIELDDDLWHIARHNPAFEFWQRSEVKDTLAFALQKADRIVVSTPALAAEVKKRTGRHPRDIMVGYNHLHPDVWGPNLLAEMPRKADLHGRTVLGWQGSPTHDIDFQVALPALKVVLQRYPHTVLRFFGTVPQTVKGAIPTDRFEWMKGVSFEHYPLTLKLASFDIGLAPLNQSTFNEAKSNIRWLEYSALHVPCVASPVGPYRDITHQETGLLARTTEEWIACLSALIEEPAQRTALATRAYDTVWAQWGPTRVQAWADLVETVWPTASRPSSIPTPQAVAL